jgi:signal peptidase I
MVSLWFLILGIVASLLVGAFFIALIARMLGSPRGRLGVGIVFILCITVVGIAYKVVVAVLGPPRGLPAQSAMLACDLVLLFLLFFIPKWTFRLGVGKTFALIGFYLLYGLIQIAFAQWFLKPHVIEAFVLPTSNMVPTLEPGDVFIANKLMSPHRWDLVVFHYGDELPDTHCDRIVALPGERLRFYHGSVYINDKMIAAPAVVEGRYRYAPRAIPAWRARYQEGDIIVLGKNEFFVVGDNVDVAMDSRMWGPIDGSKLVGVADLKYWPLNRAAILR